MQSECGVTTQEQSEMQSSGFFSDIFKLLKKYPKVSKFFMFLLSIISGGGGGFLAAYSFVSNEVGKVAQAKLVPYEALLSGLSLNQGAEFEAAAQVFKEFLDSKNIDSMSSLNIDLAFDGLLLAVANVAQPEEFQLEVNRIKARVGEKVIETPWRAHNLGWYFLRTGSLKVSREYFEVARGGFDSRREYIASVDPMRGLLLLSLIQNKPNEAYEMANKIKLRSHSGYRLNSDFVKDIQQMQSEGMFSAVDARYGEPLKKSILQYVELLESEGS